MASMVAKSEPALARRSSMSACIASASRDTASVGASPRSKHTPSKQTYGVRKELVGESNALESDGRDGFIRSVLQRRMASVDPS
eukprot:355399-Prorocentrum_minimum.AAC.1